MDILLTELFKTERWERALEIGVEKGIDKTDLRYLTDPGVRAGLYLKIKNGQYKVSVPHVALIPKDDGSMRCVMVNEGVDRIILQIVNNIFLEMFPEMIHKSCKSYQPGIGCGKVVKEVVEEIKHIKSNVIGEKQDLVKFFERVKIEYIDALFDAMERKVGKSVVIDFVREFYHCNYFFDEDGILREEYKSIKQGTATSSFMADALLYHIDEAMSNMNGVHYWRYSDDILIICEEDKLDAADNNLKKMLNEMELSTNSTKEEILDKFHWTKFLGFSIRNDMISLSPGRIKSFQKDLNRVTKGAGSIEEATHKVNKFLYGNGSKYSWATGVLPIINCKDDITTLNSYALDCIRSAETGKRNVGGLGFVKYEESHCIQRGKGRNVRYNRDKTPNKIEGFMTLPKARNALLSSRNAYDTLVRCLA